MTEVDLDQWQSYDRCAACLKWPYKDEEMSDQVDEDHCALNKAMWLPWRWNASKIFFTKATKTQNTSVTLNCNWASRDNLTQISKPTRTRVFFCSLSCSKTFSSVTPSSLLDGGTRVIGGERAKRRRRSCAAMNVTAHILRHHKQRWDWEKNHFTLCSFHRTLRAPLTHVHLHPDNVLIFLYSETLQLGGGDQMSISRVLSLRK